MKKKRMGVLATSLALVSTMVSPLSTFARVSEDRNETNFGILYAVDGQNLQEGVNVNKDSEKAAKISRLREIIDYNATVETTGNGWNEGYIRSGAGYENEDGDWVCRKVSYLVVPQAGIPSNNGNKFVVSHDGYKLEVSINRVNAELSDEKPKPVAVGVVTHETATGETKGFSAFYGGMRPYTDNQCQNRDTDIRGLETDASERVFAEMNMKLTKNDNSFFSNELYLGLGDIDAKQSYMIRDKSSQFTEDTLFTTPGALLQPTNSDLKNVYVVEKAGYPSYIYSQYNSEGHGFDETDKINLYALLSPTVQEGSGLDFVFGFAGNAGSRLEFYTMMYNVIYDAENGGKVAGNTTESVIAGNNPAATVRATPDSGYTFDGWTSDKDVQVIINGETETIKAGDVIKLDYIKTIIVNEDYHFTAHFSPTSKSYTVEYVAEEGGSIDGTEKEEVDAGGNPSGSSAQPDDGYVSDGWTTNQDVTLKDGTTIKAGEVITNEQIKQVVVDKNMKFTAHFKKIAGAPDTGAMTGKIDAATVATVSTLGLLLVAVAIKVLPQITRKRVKFN